MCHLSEAMEGIELAGLAYIRDYSGVRHLATAARQNVSAYAAKSCEKQLLMGHNLGKRCNAM